MNLYSLLTRFFEHQTRLVCRLPLLFLTLPLAVTLCLLVAAVLQMHKMDQAKQSLDIFLPDSMPSLKDLKELLRLFPPQNALRDSYSIFGSSFAYVIVEDISSVEGNILEPGKLKQVAALHRLIMQNITTESKKRFTDVCFREEPNSTCTQHPIMVALEDAQAGLAIKLLARYPTLRLSGNIVVDNAIVFGGVALSKKRVDKHGNAAIERAKAIRLLYVLDNTEDAAQWKREFIKQMSTLQIAGTSIFFTSSMSLTDEMERNGELLVPWIPWMIVLLIVFCAVICAKWDPVRSQPLIGLGAMLNAFLAIVSAISTLLYIEYPFMHMILIMPFLILSIGVDNMFLMLRSWRSFHASTRLYLDGLFSADAVFIEAISEVYVSIFVTSLTDGISFVIGTFSDFMAVRVFCTYCWLAILYMFLYQSTFLTALMALQCRREAENRHWLLCCKRINDANRNTNRELQPIGKFCSMDFYKLAAYFIQQSATKFMTLAFYCVYLFTCAYWISKLQLGLDLKLLTPDDSFVSVEFNAQERLFSDYGHFGYCVLYVDGENGIALWQREQRVKMLEFYERLTSGNFASKGDFWLAAFDASNYSEQLHFDDQTEFMKALIQFLMDQQYSKYRTDIRLTDSGEIQAIKMSYRVRKLGHKNDDPRVEFLRTVMTESGYRGFVYDTTFLLVDQQSVTRKNVLANVLAALGVMLLISAIFVPRPMASLSVALTILSINIGVVAALSAVKTRLDIVSMITIVMSIGLSFDYATHITFHFLLYRQNRIENTLRAVAIPILQAAFSTLIGVSVLAIVPSYMIRTFVYTVFFVVTIGLLHALYLLPVLLHFVVPKNEFLSTQHTSTLSIRTLLQMASKRREVNCSSNLNGNSIVYFY